MDDSPGRYSTLRNAMSLPEAVAEGGARLRILVYGINFTPEPIGIGKYTGEMACWLAERGHSVRVITAPPYYPDWSLQPSYKAWWYQRERWRGVDVIRAPLWVPHNPRGFTRLLHLTSFAASSGLMMMRQAAWRPDVVFTVAPALFCAPAGLALARLSRSLAWLHVQDFEVDTAFRLGILRYPGVERLARGLESRLLRAFDRTSTISPRMLERLERKGVPAERCVLFPNWVDCDAIYPMERPSSYRAEAGIPEDATIAMYSGALGAKQGSEILIQAAELLRHRRDIVFVVGGSGPAFRRFQQASQHLPNLRCLGLAPAERLNEWLNLADIHLMPQRADAADLVMPSKLTGMLASGRPVVATAMPGTQLAQFVSQCGRAVAPGATQALAAALIELADDRQVRLALGRRARRLAQEHMEKEAVLSRFETAILQARVGRGESQEASAEDSVGVR